MPEIDEERIGKRGIHRLRVVLNHYPAYQDKMGKALHEIFDFIRQGIFPSAVPVVYPLKDAARAHADLESRKTSGSIILPP